LGWPAVKGSSDSVSVSDHSSAPIQGANVVVLEPDVAKVFPSADAVNSSLRSLADIIRRQQRTVAAK
jgi:hypothetical protein